MDTFKIIKSNIISIFNGDDELYHIIPSGHPNRWIVVDGGPHENGRLEYLTKNEIFIRFNVIVNE